LRLLGREPNPASVAEVAAKWRALDLEAAIDEARTCGGMVHSDEKSLATPHEAVDALGQAVGDAAVESGSNACEVAALRMYCLALRSASQVAMQNLQIAPTSAGVGNCAPSILAREASRARYCAVACLLLRSPI
jgi:hypothetical protein